MNDEEYKVPWIIESQRVPPEIRDFINDTFMVIESRQRIGICKGVGFYIRSNEGNHSLPHIHACYGEHNISISINDGKIICGNLPQKQNKLAVEWVKQNRDKLTNDWVNYSISANTFMTSSSLDFGE